MPNSLDNQVLVLNRLWQPVNICSARRALGLLCLDHAHVVGTFEDNLFSTHDLQSWMRLEDGPDGWPVVRTVSSKFWLPSIIVLTAFDRLPRKEVKFSRENVLHRDGHVCQYCGERFESRDLNLDHVVPKDKGGMTTWENIVCSCIRCNSKKGNKLPSEAKMALLRKPVAPRWRPLVDFNGEVCKEHHESWRLFLEPNSASVTLSG